MPADGRDFDFTLTDGMFFAEDFTLDDADPDDGDTYTDSKSFTLPSGDYNVTEVLPDGWHLDGIQCQHSSDSFVGIDYGANRLFIDLAAGDDVTCTFNNTNQGTITIVKDATPADGRDFDFTLANDSFAEVFTLDDADPDDGDSYTDSKSFTLPSGDYNVTEVLPDGWSLEAIQCEHDDSTIGIDYGENRVFIDLATGDNVTCTFTNTKLGTVIIEKRTAPAGGTGFGFTDTIAASNSFTLDDGQSRTFLSVAPGSYVVTEDPITDGFLSGLRCDDGASATPSTWDRRRAPPTSSWIRANGHLHLHQQRL